MLTEFKTSWSKTFEIEIALSKWSICSHPGLVTNGSTASNTIKDGAVIVAFPACQVYKQRDLTKELYKKSISYAELD